MKRKTLAWAVAAVIGLTGCLSAGLATGGGGGGISSRGQEQPLVLARAGGAQDMQKRTLNIGGTERSYYLYVPRRLAGIQAPLVVAFHGGNQEVKRFAEGVGLRDMADRYGFVMAVPIGIRESWNTGSLDPSGYAEENGINDRGFVAALLDDVIAMGIANPARVYATGVSKGGMMAYDVACNLPGRFAAIAVVAGTLSSGQCANPTGVSLLHIHGTMDERVPFEGGTGEFTASNQTWTSPRRGIEIFAQNAQCSANWTASQITPDTLCSVASCPGSDVAEYCLVQGGGHTWPGVATTKRQKRQGASSTTTFSATDFIGQFFLSH